MGCNCKDNREAIADGKKVIAELRELFIKRMTVDSDTDDRPHCGAKMDVEAWEDAT